ncbi:hypothetical protein HJP15_00005 [Pseudoalteromonas sp. NEC-BIFX-2020_002]|uniref:hypothetical protein n=1 Tax=Pseudoalteromonas sp. NEC-BIFX-2020_002 TaxID=2732353 RepID=UPI00147704D5|nr:hypothetical protein [Pseudoalteromonas sp. NEC-BIFX-2020_002]NNG41334.1 hypothetical protein [Pseudoalteromonas sp. NEC-BIFX-2020_002]
MIKNISKQTLFFILLFNFITFVSACESELIAQKCEVNAIYSFEVYRKLLKEGGITINSFNLKYLKTELKENDIPDDKIINNLSKYTYILDQRQSLITEIHSYYVTCEKSNARIIIRYLSELDQTLKFFSVSMIDNKITNISEVEGLNFKGKEFTKWK